MKARRYPGKHKRRIMIVGSWAKEQATVENLKRSGNTDVFVYMDTENPGIIPLATGWTSGDFSDVKRMTRYAERIAPDLVLITTAKPLSKGLVDALRGKNIPVFGPSRNAARLESDKSFARRLLLKYGVGVAPFLRKKGMGAKLVARAEKKAKAYGCERIRVTIDPCNIPSRKLFERMGYSNISRRRGKRYWCAETPPPGISTAPGAISYFTRKYFK